MTFPQGSVEPVDPVVHNALGVAPFGRAARSLLELAQGQNLFAGLGIEEFGLDGRGTEAGGPALLEVYPSGIRFRRVVQVVMGR
jgi:hypothetical protein